MVQAEELLELLNTLMLVSIGNTITSNKETLQSVLTCLHDSQAKLEHLQAQSQLQHDKIQRRNQHCELVLV